MPANTTARSGKSTQNSLLISEIKDGVVIMHDGSLRAVVMGSAINFDLMSEEERDGVELGYQAFLNSLHFAIQIVIRSQRIDMSAYLDKLEALRSQQPNELLANLMDDYVANIRDLIEDANIMAKQFYIVVPFYPPLQEQKKITLIQGLKDAFQPPPDITVTENDFTKYKVELSQRVELVQSGLSGMGIRCMALGSQELVDLYYSWYNPEVAAAQKLVDAAQLMTPIVTKGAGAIAPGPLPGARE